MSSKSVISGDRIVHQSFTKECTTSQDNTIHAYWHAYNNVERREPRMFCVYTSFITENNMIIINIQLCLSYNG